MGGLLVGCFELDYNVTAIHQSCRMYVFGWVVSLLRA